MADPRKLSYVLSLTDSSSDGLKSADASVEKLHNSFLSIPPVAGVAITAIAAVGTEVATITAAAFALGKEFDAAWDKIRIGTGRTGADLAALQQATRDVLGNIPTDLEKASAAITGFSRLGLSGDALREVSEAVLELSRLTGTDLNAAIADSSRLFRSWRVDQENLVPTLDLLLRANQATGVSVSQLETTLVQLGPIFRAYGLSLAESTALTAGLEREGVQTEVVLRGLNTALGKLAQAGISAEQALPDILATLKEMPSATEATSLAVELFGARAGPRLVEAIRSGQLAVGELQDEIEDTGETIATAAADTDDAAETMEKAWNKLKLAAEPAGEAVFNTATAIAEHLTPAVTAFGEAVTPIVALLKGLGAGTIQFGDVAGIVAGDLAKGAVNLSAGLTPGGQIAKLLGVDIGDAVGKGLGAAGEKLDAAGRQLAADVGEGIVEPVVAALDEAGNTIGDAAADVVDGAAAAADKAANKLSGGTARSADFWRNILGLNKKDAAQIVETAIDGFIEAAAANRANLLDQFGDIGVAAASALSTALVENTKSSGASVFREVENIVIRLRQEGIENWRELGDDLAGAFHDALIARTEETKQAALAKLTEMTDAIKASRALTPENLSASLNEALGAIQLGGGAGILSGLTDAIEKGGKDARDALARQAAGWIDEVRRGLPPERANAIIAQFTDALTAAVEDKGPETRAALEDIFRSTRIEIPTAALEATLADAQARIQRTRDDALRAAEDSRRVSSDIQRRQEALSADQAARLKALEASFPSDRAQTAARTAQALAEAERKGVESVNDARFRGDSIATTRAMLAAEKAIKDIKDRAAEEQAQFDARQQKEQAIASLRETFARENATLQQTLSDEAYNRTTTQINARAIIELNNAQAKFNLDKANLEATLGLVQSVTTAADAMFDGALEDIIAIVANVSSMAEALQVAVPGGPGGFNRLAAEEANLLWAEAAGRGSFTSNVTINAGLIGTDEIVEELQDANAEAISRAVAFNGGY